MSGLKAVLKPMNSGSGGGGDARAAGFPVRGYVIRALLWSVAFGLAHLFGLRAYTSMLSGTVVPETVHIVLGTTYILLYLGFIFLVPTLLIAAGILRGLSLARAFRARRRIRSIR